MKFDIWIYNKREEIDLVVKNNEINNGRIKYNPKVKELNGVYLTMFNSFKRAINEKFNLVLTDGTKVYTSNKKLMVETLNKKDKTGYGFESWSNKYHYRVDKPNVIDNMFNLGFTKTLK